MPPRDLRGWRQYPVSAIANFEPITLADLAPEAVRTALDAYPFARFPVVREAEGMPGLLLRRDAEPELAAGRPFSIHQVPTCLREQSIGEAQARIIEGGLGVVLLLDKPGGVVIGLLTLHDLLRAQNAMTERQGEL